MTNEPALASAITEQLQNWGNEENSEALLNLVYDELRRQARRYLRKERAGHTLQTTALVHEAYLRLAKQNSVVWQNRTHFFGVAATMMRRILIDYAKARHRLRRGGAAEDLRLDEAITLAASDTHVDLLDLDEALTRLAEKDANLARIVELRFFSGLNVPATAEVLGVSESTVKRDWAMAKAWLRRELTT